MRLCTLGTQSTSLIGIGIFEEMDLSDVTIWLDGQMWFVCLDNGWQSVPYCERCVIEYKQQIVFLGEEN